MDDRIPETQAGGALVPPPRVPPRALVASALLPPPPRVTPAVAITRPHPVFIPLLDAALDELDRVGDRIAGALGVR